MLINHKYKFIYLKPSKVGGTSLEYCLLKDFGFADMGCSDRELDGIIKEGYEIPEHKRVVGDPHITLQELIDKGLLKKVISF